MVFPHFFRYHSRLCEKSGAFSFLLAKVVDTKGAGWYDIKVVASDKRVRIKHLKTSC
jgi:hypothetical protein